MAERLVLDTEPLIALILERDQALRAMPNAPPGFGTSAGRLGGPATEEALRAVEAIHGPLPPAVRGFLAKHDGWDGFPAWQGRAKLFSCADFASDETARFVAQFRGWRGRKRDRAVQTALVLGGGPGVAFVLCPRPQKRAGAASPWGDAVRTYTEKPPTEGEAADFGAFLARTAHLLAVWLDDARAALPITSADAAWACVDQAVSLFNEPDENGERGDESARAIDALRARLDRSVAPRQHALLARLVRELHAHSPYSRARRHGEEIELLEHATNRWVR